MKGRTRKIASALSGDDLLDVSQEGSRDRFSHLSGDSGARMKNDERFHRQLFRGARLDRFISCVVTTSAAAETRSCRVEMAKDTNVDWPPLE